MKYLNDSKVLRNNRIKFLARPTWEELLYMISADLKSTKLMLIQINDNRRIRNKEEANK